MANEVTTDVLLLAMSNSGEPKIDLTNEALAMVDEEAWKQRRLSGSRK